VSKASSRLCRGRPAIQASRAGAGLNDATTNGAVMQTPPTKPTMVRSQSVRARTAASPFIRKKEEKTAIHWVRRHAWARRDKPQRLSRVDRIARISAALAIDHATVEGNPGAAPSTHSQRPRTSVTTRAVGLNGASKEAPECTAIHDHHMIAALRRSRIPADESRAKTPDKPRAARRVSWRYRACSRVALTPESGHGLSGELDLCGL